MTAPPEEPDEPPLDEEALDAEVPAGINAAVVTGVLEEGDVPSGWEPLPPC